MWTTWSENVLPTALAFVAGSAAFLWFFLAPDARERALRPLPCPKSTLPILGNTLDLMFYQLPRLHDWILEQCLMQNGKTWRLSALGAPPLVVVSSVACFEDVLKTQFEIFDKGPRMNTIFRDVLGDSITAVDGEKWRQQRKALVHLFTMRQFRDTIGGSIESHLQRFGTILDRVATTNGLLDLGEAFQRYTFDTFTDIAFGFDEHCLDRIMDLDGPRSDDAAATDALFQAMNQLLTLMEMRFHQPDWLWQLKRALNIGDERTLRVAVAAMDRKMYAVIERMLAQQTPHRHDVVSLVVDHLDDLHDDEIKNDPYKLTKYLRDVGITMLAAGKDTSSTTLMWCMVTFAMAPDVMRKIRVELKTELPQLFTDKTFVPSMDTIESHLVYLEAAIRETLRLYAPLPLNAKEANQDVTLCDGTFMKRGTRVYIPSYALARLPSVWGPDATEFKPERWIDEAGKLRTVSSFQFVAFHAGPRICVGMRFALIQLKTTLAYLLSKYDITFEKDPHDYTYEMAINLSVKGPLRGRLSPLKQ